VFPFSALLWVDSIGLVDWWLKELRSSQGGVPYGSKNRPGLKRHTRVELPQGPKEKEAEYEGERRRKKTEKEKIKKSTRRTRGYAAAVSTMEP
jgi:hypothetical protein